MVNKDGFYESKTGTWKVYLEGFEKPFIIESDVYTSNEFADMMFRNGNNLTISHWSLNPFLNNGEEYIAINSNKIICILPVI